MEKTKKIIAIVAACLVVLATGMGVGYKIWFNEDMPVVEGELDVVFDSTEVADDTMVVEAVEAVEAVEDSAVAE